MDVVNGCYIDMLVDVIDDKVEKVDNYKEGRILLGSASEMSLLNSTGFMIRKMKRILSECHARLRKR